MPARSDNGRTAAARTRQASVSAPSDTEIAIVRTFAAPRAIVFDAWTKPEHVAGWWDPSGARLAECAIDLRPGGAFRWVHAGGQQVFEGVYLEIAPPGRLVFAARTPLRSESIGTLVFDERGGETTLTMTIACASKAERDALLGMRIDAGTLRTLENLDDYLSSAD